MLGPGNAGPLGVVSSLYPASSSPYMVLSLSSTLARTYMPTSLLPWLGLLVQALTNMKTILVAFVLPPCQMLLSGIKHSNRKMLLDLTER